MVRTPEGMGQCMVRMPEGMGQCTVRTPEGMGQCTLRTPEGMRDSIWLGGHLKGGEQCIVRTPEVYGCSGDIYESFKPAACIQVLPS